MMVFISPCFTESTSRMIISNVCQNNKCCDLLGSQSRCVKEKSSFGNSAAVSCPFRNIWKIELCVHN